MSHRKPDRKSVSKRPALARELSRREFLTLGLLGTLATFVIAYFIIQMRGRMTFYAEDLGISPANDGVTNRENLVSRLSGFRGEVIFPAGDYLVDNSVAQADRGLDESRYIVVEDFEGEFVMEPGARLVFTDAARRGLNFSGGTGASFRRVRTTYSDLPASRIDSEGPLTFLSTTDTVVEDTHIDRSPAAGLLFYHCVRPEASNIEVINTMADGVHFANCEDGRITRLRTRNTGDDGLAFVNYGLGPDNKGGHASDIEVEDAKGRGIAIIGQDDVLVDGFRVVGTSFDGLICAQEDFWKTRVPARVKFTNGEIYDAGTVYDPEGKEGNHFGIHFANVVSVEFANIRVEAPRDRGVSGTAASFTRDLYGGGAAPEPAGTVSLKKIEVRDAPGVGITVYGGSSLLEDVRVSGCGGTGIAFVSGGSVECRRLRVVNASKRDELRRALLFDGNGNVEADEIVVGDDQTEPTGFVVGTYGEQSGSLGRITDSVENGSLRFDNFSRLAYALDETV